MELNHLCTGIKERVALELQEQSDPATRTDLLIAALYDVSRVVLPALGPPRKSLEYQAAREAALELVTCIAIPLIRGGDRRGAVVLSQLAEECQDPLLRKKLSVYAQQLLAERAAASGSRSLPGARTAAWVASACIVPALAFYLVRPFRGEESKSGKTVAASLTPEQVAPKAAPSQAPAAPAPAAPAAEPARAPEQCQPVPQRQEKAPPAPPAGAEQVTRVRIVNNQVLVPVVLKHGGGTVKLELVLDTGATRTAVHEDVAGRLPIDLRSARAALAEVADGRIIRSKLARIDLLSVGPFAHPSMELELIPFQGSQGMHDGLLGMDFLGRHRYQIDMEHELIRWF